MVTRKEDTSKRVARRKYEEKNKELQAQIDELTKKLEEIKKVVRDNHDKTVDFLNVPDAQQYRESEMIRARKNNL